jgi:hypothetical protein
LRTCIDPRRQEGTEMNREQRSRLIQIGLVVLALLAAPLSAYSQGCALCYTQAASAGARMIASLRSGILILIIPPMLMTLGVAVVAYRRRNYFTNHEPDSDLTDNNIP